MIKIGKYTYGKPQIETTNKDFKLTIGNFCVISSNVTIYLPPSHISDWVSTYPFGQLHTDKFSSLNTKDSSPLTKKCIIGNDVYIGSNVRIMAGVRIGDGAIILSNSNVVGNVRPYSVVGGNPAKETHLRFTPEQIDSLLKIQWWNWEDDQINNYVNLLHNDVDTFIKSVI